MAPKNKFLEVPLKDNTYYKGYTQNYLKRLEQHNRGESQYTSSKIPWKLVYVEECKDKRSALKREKSLKRANLEYIKWLIHQNSNILNG